jgi:hypothetical protein
MLVVSALAAVQQSRAANSAAKSQFQNLHQGALNNNARIKFSQGQINRQAAGELFDSAVEAEKGRSAAIVAAGEAGVTGNSVTAILGESFFNSGLDASRIMANARAAQQNLMFGGQDAQTNIQSGINQVQTVSGMELAGQLAGTALSNRDAFRRPKTGVPAEQLAI